MRTASNCRCRTKQPRRNAKDPCRILLHKLFDEISEEVEQNLDNIAGRAAQLVGTAEGKTQPVGLESSLREYPLTLTSGHDQVTALADALSSSGKKVRQAIGQSFEYGDAVTANIFTRVAQHREMALDGAGSPPRGLSTLRLHAHYRRAGSINACMGRKSIRAC